MTPLTHPLVEGYLRELDRLLAGLPFDDRAEVVGGVREHLDATLGSDATEAGVRRALEELGPPSAVAAEAYAGAPPSGVPERRPAMQRSWVPVVVIVLEVVVLGFAVLMLTSAGGVVVSTGSTTTAAGQTVETSREVLYSGVFGFGLLALLMTSPLWIGVGVLATVSPLWSGRAKAPQVLLVPVVVLAMFALPDLGWAVAGEHGVGAGAIAALLLGTVGAGVAVWRLSRPALRAAG